MLNPHCVDDELAGGRLAQSRRIADAVEGRQTSNGNLLSTAPVTWSAACMGDRYDERLSGGLDPIHDRKRKASNFNAPISATEFEM
jgi:hypothetical protein